VFTQCPDCGTVFRVTATVLRAARGQVRCGVCDATFDALQYLTEEVDADTGGDASGGRGTGDAPRTDRTSNAPTGDTAEHESLSVDDDGPVDAAAVEDGELDDEPQDEDFEDEDEDDGLSDAETEERILEAAQSEELRIAQARDHAASFPLEELDDPIDVLAPPDTGPEPEFPPFTPEPAANDVAPMAAAAPGSDDRDARPLETEPTFFARAGRTTPSADEDRALAEIAAALARRAQSPAPAPAPAPAADSPSVDEFLDLDDVPSIEVDLLDASAAENIVLAGGDDIPDSALEFDLPAEEWERVFVPDADAPTIPPLDAGLARARAEALRAPPHAPPGTRAPGTPVDDDEFELEFDSDDGDLDDDDLRERGLDEHGQSRAVAPAPAAAPPLGATANSAVPEPRSSAEDPLARTDEFPPLRLTLAEEAAAGLADTPNAKPRTGVTPEDFDALVAAAAARAAAEVAARVGVPPAVGTATIPAPSLPPATPAAPTATRAAVPGVAAAAAPPIREPRAPAPAAAPFREPLETSDGAEATWFDARRDLAPEGAAIAQAEPGELIHFDAQRFQAIARGRERRPWWVSTLLPLGVVVLALGLLAQGVHYWRDTLAQHPVVGPPLQDAYARLGLPLEPEWNLGAYEVKQWGATSDVAPGTLRVRASVVNRAARAQPHPLLRVTLLDRFSGKVARREFRPEEYLPGRAAPAGLLAAGARVDADLVIADPGSDAVGFELDVCLMRRGVLTCGGDARVAAP
jgi:predicted Zn finger-like uncharacterized protein